MRADDLTLQSFLAFDPDAGLIQAGLDRAVLLDTRSLGLLRQELLRLLGPDLGRDLLLRFGYVWGSGDARRLRAAFSWDNDEELLRAGPRAHTLRGVVRVVLDEVQLDRGTGRLRMTAAWHQSFEAEQHLQMIGSADTPVCYLLSGYASGYVSEVVGATAVCEELACVAMGAPVCRVRVLPAAEAGAAADVLRHALTRADMPNAVVALEQEVERRGNHVAGLASAAQALTGSLDLETVARVGLGHVLNVIGFDAGEVLVWDSARNALVQRTHAGAHPDVFAEPRAFVRDGATSGDRPPAPAEALRLAARDLTAAGFQTVLSTPLRVENDLVGVMTVAAFEPRTGEDLPVLLAGLGGQLGIAIDRAEANERERSLRRRLEALNEAALAIAGELSLPALLQRIVDIARDLTRARYAALGVTGEGGRLAQFITSGISEEDRARIGPPPEGHGLLGLILRGATPVRVANIAAHPAAHGFPPYHPAMTSFLGAPILLRGRNLGNLYLTDKQDGQPFTDEDERVLVQLAAHAAIAIENARLYGRTSEALEQRLVELRDANAQLAYLSSLAINAQEEERRRLARELHDGTAQSLASLLVRLRVMERTADPRQAQARLEEVRELIARALDDVRRMAIDLRPSALDDLGLAPAVEAFANDLSERGQLRVRFSGDGIDRRLPSAVEVVVYRIVQEALTNVVKHAHASEATVQLKRHGRTLRVMVQDNGRGFDVAEALASKERGLGLFGMQERAGLVGGRLDVQSTPGAGTTVAVTIPLPEDADRGESAGST